MAVTTEPQSGATDTTENVGRIEEIQGVVIEAVFPEHLPEINTAIIVRRTDANREESDPEVSGGSSQTNDLVCEVQQHLGDDRVRAVAMDSTDGLARGMEVNDTGAPITVPVGALTLGRIWTAVREPVDEKPDVPKDTERWSIHRDPPKFT